MSRQDITNNLTAAARSSASSSSLRRRSSLLKRDSAVSLGHAGSRSDARRISVRRSFQSAEAAFIEDDLAEFLAEQPFAGNMGPVYRLKTPLRLGTKLSQRINDPSEKGRLIRHRPCFRYFDASTLDVSVNGRDVSQSLFFLLCKSQVFAWHFYLADALYQRNAASGPKSEENIKTDATTLEQYPHQTASGRREIRAASDQHNSSRPASRLQEPRSPERADIADAGTESTTHTTQLTTDSPHKPAVQDFQHRHQPSRTSSSRPLSPTASAPQYHASSSPPREPSFAAVDADAGRNPKTWTRNSIRIPPRTSSSGQNNAGNTTGSNIDNILQRMPSTAEHPEPSRDSLSEPTTPDTMNDPQYGVGDRSSRDSRDSIDTSATSIHTLPPLQTKGVDHTDAHALEPLMEDDPRSFDLFEPPQEESNVGVYELEKQALQLFSSDHLSAIFANSKLLLRFTGFLNSHRPQNIPLLIYYLDALKALRAIKYANAVAEALEPIPTCDFTKGTAEETANNALQEKANKAFEILVKEDLPAYIAYTWIQVVSTSIQRRITGTLAPHLRETSEGLAEVFCLSDPSRADNPIVFASEEFSRTTQYGLNYSIGRNCRFLQGPKTDSNSTRRLAEACRTGKEQSEVFVNYRRDGSPFMNLLMIAPLMDSRGIVRYFIGAQVDVSGLLKSCSELPGLTKLVDDEWERKNVGKVNKPKRDEFQELSEMFNAAELSTVHRYGGSMHREYVDDSDTDSVHGGTPQKPRLMLSDPTQETLDKQKERIAPGVPPAEKERINGKLAGVYQNYLLIRPAPSLRILFTSPSLRVPGILQSPFLNRIGGSPRVRADLSAALSEGRGVTAKIRWLARPDEEGEGEGRPRWIHCTPLLGHTGAVGVWMVVLIDEEGSHDSISANRRFRTAPPVSTSIGRGSNDYDGARRTSGGAERRHLNAYDADAQRRGAGSGATAPNSANYFSNFNGSNGNIHSSADSINRRPSNGSISGPLTSSREYPPSASQFSLHAGERSPASSRAQSMTKRGGNNGANFGALDGHIASQMNGSSRPDYSRRNTNESQNNSVRL